MSNDDWSDTEIDRGGRAVDREIERLRRVYQKHAETLSSLASSAPTKALARKYHDLIGDINRSILSLDDPGAIVERDSSERPVVRTPRPSADERPQARAAPHAGASEVRLRTEPGLRTEESGGSAFGRIALILGMAIVVISLLAFFVWKFGGDARQTPSSSVKPGTTRDVELPVSTPTEPLSPISAAPEAQDFGVVYKATRVTKSFEVFNNTDRDITIEIERSTCRCLWFDYPALVPAGGSVSVSITIDGGRAAEGLLSEAVVIATKDQPRVATEVEVTAEIR